METSLELIGGVLRGENCKGTFINILQVINKNDVLLNACMPSCKLDNFGSGCVLTFLLSALSIIKVDVLQGRKT